jgi:hypothetical protein
MHQVHEDPYMDLQWLSLSQALPPPSSSLPSQAAQQILHHPELKRLGFVVNTGLSILICWSCQYAVDVDHVEAHCSDQHSDAKLKVDSIAISLLARQLGVQNVFAKIPNHSAPPYKGLLVKEGLLCSCGYAVRKKKNMVAHMSRVHQKSPIYTYSRALLQQYNPGNHKTYWACHETNWREDLSDQAQQFLQKAALDAEELQRPVHHDTDAREISPWLLTTKWLDLIRGHDPATLVQFVAVATHKTWEAQLPPLIKTYMTAILNMSMHEIELQRLNTADPAKGSVFGSIICSQTRD